MQRFHRFTVAPEVLVAVVNHCTVHPPFSYISPIPVGNNLILIYNLGCMDCKRASLRVTEGGKKY